MRPTSTEDAESSLDVEYSQMKKRILGPVLAVLLFLSWFPVLIYGQFNPLAAIFLNIVIALFLLYLLSFLQVKIERKYKKVSATLWDYFVTNAPFGLAAIVPGLFTLGFNYMLPRFGFLTILYMDAITVSMLLVLVRFPPALHMGLKRTPIRDKTLVSSFSKLAARMGVDNVSLYSVDYEKFKVANAFQAGSRKFSINISNYLLKNMPMEEIIAVMAHELAHAKMRHVEKLFVFFLFPLLIEINLFIIAALLSPSSFILGLILCAVGFISLFLTPRIAFRYQRGFELDADAIAVKTLGDARTMIGALEKLGQLNLIPRDNDSLTHPSMVKRIQQIKANQRDE